MTTTHTTRATTRQTEHRAHHRAGHRAGGRTARALAVGALALAVGVALAGCQGRSAPGAAAGPTASAGVVSAAPPTATPTTTGAATPVSTPVAAPAQTPAATAVPGEEAAPTLDPGYVAGPIELATSACMAERGYDWDYAIGMRIAAGERVAAKTAIAAGAALTDPATRAAQDAAAAAIIGIDPSLMSPYRTALTGLYANDPQACGAIGLTAAVEPTSAQLAVGDFGQDWSNFRAVTRACLAASGFPLTVEQDEAMREAQRTFDAGSGLSIAQVRADAVGWPVERIAEFDAADYGDTGAGPDYHWEEAGCAGFATHVTGNDHNN